MDKISKALKKFDNKERERIKEILLKLKNNDRQGLEIKKLKGYDNIFRIKKGRIRIIYRIDKDDNFFILAIERRCDSTYKF